MFIFMNHLLTYSGINTKIKAMDARLISKDEYYKISNIETVPDFIAFLKTHPGYKEILSRYDEHELHRSDVERILINSLYVDYIKIYRFANQDQRKALEFIFFRYEINVIKSCLRLIYNAEDNYDLSSFDYFFRKHSEIDVSSLAASQSIEEFIQHLQGSKYFIILSKILNSNQFSSFDFEIQLDIYYFTNCWKRKDKLLTGTNLKIFTEQLGTEIDLQNILWIYRSKASYDMIATDILPHIIPINYKLSKEQLFKLINTATMDEFLAILRNSDYKSIATALQDNTVEAVNAKILQSIYKKNKEKYPATIATLIYYLYLKDKEISQLTTAIESIRYQLDPQEKLQYILR